ncbi:hypothetical protein LSI54_09750, partial [Nesterenkonia sp. AY15]|nr:hypothetical protein [Nesterenkonia sp. AY15]
MTDPINTSPRPSNPEDAASKTPSAAEPRTSSPDSDATGPVPAVHAAPSGLEPVTGEPGYSARHASETGSPGTTDQSRSGPASASRPSTGQSTSDQGSSEQGRSDQATSDQAKSDQAKSDQAKSAAQDVAGDAKDAGRAVKDTAAQEAAGVKDDAVREAKRLGGEASTMLESQAAEQLDRAAVTVRTFSDDVGRIARGEKPEPGVAKDLVDQLNSRAETTASWLEDHDPKEVLQEVQSFARRRPVAFLAIAAGVGFAAGRLTRGISQHHADDD